MSPTDAAIALPDPLAGSDEAIIIRVIDHDGVEHCLPALTGWHVMEVIRDWGLDIKAECGGACACATCHVHVVDGQRPALPEPSEEEADQLDTAFFVQDNSRLSCQLLVTPGMDGLAVRLAPGTKKTD
jgi:2Fe-2S ferredoxin